MKPTRFITVLFVLVILVSTNSIAGLINLPRTGQTTCYDVSGNVIDCTSTGQNGEIQAGVAWPEPKFTSNSDITVTDYLTSLIWGLNGNIMPFRGSNWDIDAILNDGKVIWSHELYYLAKLNAEDYLGHNDLYLPNINELERLVNTDMLHQAGWFHTQGFSNVHVEDYWSSTTYDSNNIETKNKLNGNLKADDQYASHLVYTIQIESRSKIADTQKQFNFILRSLNKENLNLLRIEKVGKYYTLRLGKFENYETAKKFLQEIKPRLSEAIILKAYIKNERIIRSYE